MAKKKTTKRKTTATKKIGSVKHKDKRKNIPTEELRNFVAEDELKPKEVKLPGLLYARDPSLDPQLVWKGKDKQDHEELTVPAVPIYIQEKVNRLTKKDLTQLHLGVESAKSNSCNLLFYLSYCSLSL